jgi:ubiquinone biosynthesis accessory factor UbiJ
MLHAIQTTLTHEGMTRAVLLVNHVLSSEPAAAQRLRAHVGKRLRLQPGGWPGWLPPLPDLTFRITPAALVEWCGEAGGVTGEEPVALQIGVDASNPAKALVQALAGERPHVEVSGDAAFATDVNWLFDHLRWDIEDDLAKVVGAAPAHELARLGRAVAAGLRDAVNGVGAVASRLRRGGSPGG